MARYLLDTNACIRFLNCRAPKLRDALQAKKASDITTCLVVKAELFACAHNSTDPVRALARQVSFLSEFVSLPFDDAAAAECGTIRPWLERQGTPIGPHDLQIAAIAIVNSLTLITHNTREFGRVFGLALEDWE